MASDGIQEVSHATHRAAGDAQGWLIWFGRFGFAAKGVVYTLIGVLAVQAAIGTGGQTTGQNGALEQIGEAPFGRFLLIAIGVGIVGYALWRFIQAFMDTENKGTGAKGMAIRAGYFVIALLHVSIAASAFALVAGKPGNGDSTSDSTAQLMSQPFGKWLVALVGAAVIAYGAAQLYRAYSVKFRKKLLLGEMSEAQQKWAIRLGCTGYAARGVVFAIVGIFLIVAALHANPQEARGLDGALAALAQQPWGSAMLGAVAVGLVAYGIFMFVQARYRRMVIS